MRVLVVSTWYPTVEVPLRTPFVPRHVRAIARRHEVHVIHVQLLNASGVRHEGHAGVALTRVGFDPRAPRTVVTAWREIRRWARYADVVHTMAFSSALVAAPAVGRTPWVHTEHWNGVLFPAHVNALWQRFAWLRHVLRLPRLVTGISTLMTERLADFARPGAARLIGNVVDHAPDVAPPPRTDELRLIAVGSVTEHKGALLAVETVAWLRARGHDASLVWDGDGPLRPRAPEYARELGVADHVEFRGSRTPEQVWQDLAEARIFILPSKSESFCVAAAEALAAGRPVVMGARGGQRDFVDEKNGRLVPEVSAETLGHAVLEVAAGQGMVTAQEMAREIRGTYGENAVGDQLSALYRDAVHLAPRRCGAHRFAALTRRAPSR